MASVSVHGWSYSTFVILPLFSIARCWCWIRRPVLDYQRVPCLFAVLASSDRRPESLELVNWISRWPAPSRQPATGHLTRWPPSPPPPRSVARCVVGLRRDPGSTRSPWTNRTSRFFGSSKSWSIDGGLVGQFRGPFDKPPVRPASPPILHDYSDWADSQATIAFFFFRKKVPPQEGCQKVQLQPAAGVENTIYELLGSGCGKSELYTSFFFGVLAPLLAK